MAKTLTIPHDRLLAARRAAGLTQAQLSERTGYSQRFISNIETGSREGSIETYQRLARALGVTVSYLAGEKVQDWQEGGGREAILKDPLAAPGLQSLARNGALCDLLGIDAKEWAALRSLQSPRVLSQDAYLIILHALRGGGMSG